jgi:hypothetical protein
MGCASSKPALYPNQKAHNTDNTDKKKIEHKKWTPEEVPEIKLFTFDVNDNNSCTELPFQ